MSTARAVLLSALILAASLFAVTWWTIRSQPQPERYQLVNVGKGETQRLDTVTGTVTRCSYGRCEALTDGAKVIDKPEGRTGTPVKTDIPPPPSGFTLDN